MPDRIVAQWDGSQSASANIISCLFLSSTKYTAVRRCFPRCRHLRLCDGATSGLRITPLSPRALSSPFLYGTFIILFAKREGFEVGHLGVTSGNHPSTSRQIFNEKASSHITPVASILVLTSNPCPCLGRVRCVKGSTCLFSGARLTKLISRIGL